MSTAPAPAPRPVSVLVDVVWVSVLVSLGVLLPWVLGQRFGVDVAVGPDAPLWASSAIDRLHGVGTAVPPLYGLLSAAVAVLGVPVVVAAQGWSVAAAGVAAAIVYVGLRGVRVSVPAAAAGGLLVALHADTQLHALMVQPDALAAASLGLLGGALVLHADRRSPASLGAVVGASAVVVLAREHGLVLLPLIALFLVVWPPAMRGGRAVSVLALALAVELAAGLAGAGFLRAPFDWPWLVKFDSPIQDLGKIQAGEAPSFVGVGLDSAPVGDRKWLSNLGDAYTKAMKLPPEARWEAVLRLQVARAVHIAGDLHRLALWSILAAAGYAIQRRRASFLAAVALPLSAILPTIAIWSARRHAAVLVPVAAIGVALGVEALRGVAARRTVRGGAWLSWGLLVAVAAAAWLGGHRARTMGLGWLGRKAEAGRSAAALGEAIRDIAPAGSYLVGVEHPALIHTGGLVHVYAELPWLHPSEARTAPLPAHGWRSLWLRESAAGPPGPGWEVVLEQAGQAVYQLDPNLDAATRRCRAGDLAWRPRTMPPHAGDPVPTAVPAPGCAAGGGR